MKRATLLGTLALLAFSPSCELVVGDSVPTNIACEGTLASSCPTDFQCVTGICVKCVQPGCATLGFDAGHDAGHDGMVPNLDTGLDVTTPGDAGHHDAVVIAPDTGVDAGPPAGEIGAACSPSQATQTAACQTALFCLDTVNLPGLGLGSGGVCSATCCDDSDCGAGVCYPTTGGNYCITQALASKCSGGSCGTACCTDGACDNDAGPYCAPGSGEGSAGQGASVPSCRAPDPSPSCIDDSTCTGSAGSSCYADSDCDQGVCVDSNENSCPIDGEENCTCAEATPCCATSPDCDGLKGATCIWFATTTVTLRTCGTGGKTQSGRPCSSNSVDGNGECEGNVCAPFEATQSLCTQPCCQDSDCTGIASPDWACRPANLTLGNGPTEILVCQPPPSSIN